MPVSTVIKTCKHESALSYQSFYYYYFFEKIRGWSLLGFSGLYSKEMKDVGKENLESST